MGRIHKLDLFTSNRIAAGEVVERPASVVKELVENAIDAGSSAVSVEIKNGGSDLISIADNGSGIATEDAVLAFERHATSKISGQNDLDSIQTLGFRGEALSSIAAVAQVEMQSRMAGQDSGVLVCVHGGALLESAPYGCPPGTAIRVENLFYNTPARLRFLKKPAYEGAAIANIIARYIMANPHISFKFIQEGKLIYHSPGDGDLLTAIYCVYGRDATENLLAIKGEKDGLKFHGYISRPEGSRPNRNAQSFFVNGRYIQSSLLSRALQNAYGHRLMVGKFPMAVLFVELPYDAVDVNIHPNKMEIRFKQEDGLSELLGQLAKNVLDGARVVDWHYAEKGAAETQPVVKSSVQPWQPGAYFAEGRLNDVDGPAQPQLKQNQINVAENDDNEKGDNAQELPPIRKTAAFPIQEESIQLNEKSAPAEPEKLDDSALREIRLDVEDDWSHVLHVREPSAALVQEPLFAAGEKSEDNFQVIGQLFATYILIQAQDTLYLIDQHAAHERVIFDQMLSGVRFGSAQQLILPYEMVMEGEEAALLKELLPDLTEMGFAFRWEDETLIQVTALPQLFEEAETGDFLREVIEAFQRGTPDMVDTLKQERLAQYACKHAIRGQDMLTNDEMTSLIGHFREMGELNCPHGRPILIRIARRELEKMFKRIV